MNKNTMPFKVDIEGETTGTRWTGNFEAKIRLSHADELQRDRLRREYLGPNPEQASERAKDQANILSQLAVRVTKAPLWWSENRGGLDLCDDSVIAEVFAQAVRVEKETLDEVRKKAEEAKQGLMTPTAS